MTITKCDLETVVEGSKAKSIVMMLVPIGYLTIMSVKLMEAGHRPLDYFSIINAGELSIIRQSVGLVALIVVILAYIPPAYNIIKNGFSLAVEQDHLILPSGETILIEEISRFRIARGFWQRKLEIETKEGLIVSNLTFAKGRTSDICEKIMANRKLHDIPVSI